MSMVPSTVYPRQELHNLGEDMLPEEVKNSLALGHAGMRQMAFVASMQPDANFP